ncbi:hypothetical protein B0H13DRAFT_1853789 [Mycena leptocephala]|nr:hypothetical protein B0H13DRAFT_1853789 [Mycena leptocephala]
MYRQRDWLNHFGHLGLRWGLTSRWIGHPSSTLLQGSESPYIVFALFPDCWSWVDFSCGFPPTDSRIFLLWSAVWPLILFLDSYRDSIPGIHALRDLQHVYRPFLSFISATALLQNTPHFRVLIVRMWAVFLENPNLEDETGKFRFCTYIQSCPSVTKDWHFEEKVEGAGGMKTLVAALIVKHLKCLAD